MLRRALPLSAAALTHPARAQMLDLRDAINTAGRQRMLSRRMAKFYLAATMPVEPDVASGEINRARAECVAALDTLHAARETTPRIKDELQRAEGP